MVLRVGKLVASPRKLMRASHVTRMNHRTTTVVLFADGNVGTVEISDLWKDGTMIKDEKIVIVGPDSPVEMLRSLSLD